MSPMKDISASLVHKDGACAITVNTLGKWDEDLLLTQVYLVLSDQLWHIQQGTLFRYQIPPILNVPFIATLKGHHGDGRW